MVESEIHVRDKAIAYTNMFMHWSCHLFLALSIAAGLWKHGHPLFTLLCIVAVLPLALLVYIPERFFSKEMRGIFQIFVLAGAMGWAGFRFFQHIPPDKLLIESICIVGLSFSITPSPKSYSYQILISLVLILYGAVFPRASYLYLLPALLMCGLLMAYQSRTIGLGRDIRTGIPKGVFRLNWYYLLMHFTLAVLLGIYIYVIFPSPDKAAVGFIRASFRSENEEYMPMNFNRWIKSEHVKKKPGGEIKIPGRTPESLGKKGPMVAVDNKDEAMNADGNSGGGAPGDDLVFRVKSPVKLYWLGALFDYYDGMKWVATKQMRKQKVSIGYGDWQDVKHMKQIFLVEKWNSPILFSGFMPTHFYVHQTAREEQELINQAKVKSIARSKALKMRKLRRKQNALRKSSQKNSSAKKTAQKTSKKNVKKKSANVSRKKPAKSPKKKLTKKPQRQLFKKRKTTGGRNKKNKKLFARRRRKKRKKKVHNIKTFYNEKFPPNVNYPELPCKYSVTSVLNVFTNEDKRPAERKKKPRFWYETLKPDHYLQLPKNISQRLKDLALKITADKNNPFDRAIALRDYLRNNFSYKLQSDPVPPGREATDFFVFELKKGHCEYFASSLTVLARICGLPARVATGFSPGNFNSLNGFFEVYEYHGHAWTQIFVEGKGWLTFDATPQGQVVSRTTPLGFGLLQDPFGDEWRIMPPEMTEVTQKYVKKREVFAPKKMTKADMEDNKTPAIAQMVMRIPMTEEEFKKTLDKWNDGKLPELKAKGEEKMKQVFDAVKTNLMLMIQRIFSTWRAFVHWIVGINGIVILSLAVILMVIRFLFLYIKEKTKRLIRFRRCSRLYQRAAEKIQTDPKRTISLCYRMVRELLELAGLPRKRNMELFDYGASLKNVDKDLCKDALVIFFIYSQARFSIEPSTAKDANEVYDRSTHILTFLRGSKKKSKYY